MANYENGVFTRQAIIRSCKKLFLEKGYHETIYADICNDAHVNRTTVYYHFKDKEQMRYEVQWECTMDLKHIAERYCDKEEYHFLLTAYLLWYKIKEDENFRRFQYSHCIDYPLISNRDNFHYFYINICKNMWQPFFDISQISDLAFASFYGYIICCIRMLCEHPEKYEAMEIFEMCVNSCIFVWGISQDTVAGIWADVKHYISLIPEEEIQLQLP